MVKNVFCPYCKKELNKSDIKNYPYVCLNCDENFYKFESVKNG